MSDDQDHQHESPIKTPKQLLIVVVLAFVVPIALIVLLSQLVTGGEKGLKDPDDAILARIKAVGDVVIAEPSGPKGQATGEQVFNQVCKTCHEPGLAGSPKVGDKAAWAKVIAQGQATAVEHAIKGIRAMPAKGGNPDLENVEVERAVVFMANKSGATWKEPPAPAMTAAVPAPAPAAAPAAAPSVVSTAAAAPVPAPAAATAAPAAAAAPAAGHGKQVYDTTCAVCHAQGIAGAPKFGDKDQWAPRLKTGMDTLYATALKGKGAMPPKGGNMALSDADVKAGVDYMTAAVK